MGASGVKDHWQIVLLCQPQLRIKDLLLLIKLRILPIEIQPNLAYRHQPGRPGGQLLGQSVNAGWRMVFYHDRMESQRGIDGVKSLCQRQHAGKICRFGGGHDNRLNARCSGLSQALRLLAGKGRKVKVTVGIDKALRHAEFSLLKVVSLACGASTSVVVSASFATTAGGTTTVAGVIILGAWRSSGGSSTSSLPTVARK